MFRLPDSRGLVNQMNSRISCLIFASVLLSMTSVLPASAQDNGYSGWHRGWLRPGERLGGGAGFHGQVGGNRGWGGGESNWRGTAYGGVNPAALGQFDARVNQLRNEIAARVAARAISPAQAYRVNQELAALETLRGQILANGGAGGANQVGDLNRRLVQLQMTLRSPIQF